MTDPTLSAPEPGGYIVDRFDVLIRSGAKFGCVYADPPWQYDRSPRGSAERHYPTMTLDDIAALPVRELVAANAHLHLWTTHSFLFDARRVLDAWGFEYKGIFVWVKPRLGTGYYWRSAAEFLLLGVRGNCTFLDRSIPNWLCHDRHDHSHKPERVRGLVERVSPGPFLELFGRRAHHGWTVFGNEVGRGLFDGDISTLSE